MLRGFISVLEADKDLVIVRVLISGGNTLLAWDLRVAA
jgi:hypothetical protein